MFASVAATEAEKRVQRPGDDLVDPADVVMDRAFTVPGLPEQVWPWLVQLGKQRAGWYLPAGAERFLPRSRRGARTVNPAWLGLRPGDVIRSAAGPHGRRTGRPAHGGRDGGRPARAPGRRAVGGLG